MRHKVIKHSFGRRPSARKALMRGLVDALVEHGRIKTTLPKAKELRRHVEKAVTAGKKGSVHSRRVLLSKYPNKNTIKSLVDDLGPRFKERPGGYTRIIKLGRRVGDMAPMALIEFVDYKAPDLSQDDREQALQAENKLVSQRKAQMKKTLRVIQTTSRKRNR